MFPCESIVRSRGAPWLVGTVRGWLLVGARGSVQRKSPRVGCEDGRAAAESADSSDDGIRQSTNFYAEGARSFLPSRIPPQFLGLSWFTLYFAWAVFVWRFFMQSHRVHLARSRAAATLVSSSCRPLLAFLYSFAYYSAFLSFGRCHSTASCSYLLCTHSTYLHLFIALGISEIFSLSFLSLPLSPNPFFYSVDLSFASP